MAGVGGHILLCSRRVVSATCVRCAVDRQSQSQSQSRQAALSLTGMSLFGLVPVHARVCSARLCVPRVGAPSRWVSFLSQGRGYAFSPEMKITSPREFKANPPARMGATSKPTHSTTNSSQGSSQGPASAHHASRRSPTKGNGGEAGDAKARARTAPAPASHRANGDLPLSCTVVIAGTPYRERFDVFQVILGCAHVYVYVYVYVYVCPAGPVFIGGSQHHAVWYGEVLP